MPPFLGDPGSLQGATKTPRWNPVSHLLFDLFRNQDSRWEISFEICKKRYGCVTYESVWYKGWLFSIPFTILICNSPNPLRIH